MRAALARLALVAAVLLAWSPQTSAFDPPLLTALLEQSRLEMKAPGLSAAVRLPDGDIVSAAVGVADKESGRPLDTAIGMPGGSTGKTFVAALALLLVEEGRLLLDDPAGKWLGHEAWFSRLPNSETIRVRHLLSHSAGIKDYIETPGFYWAMIRRVLGHGSAMFEPEELIDFVLDRRPLFPAGAGYHYSDAGYLVLGRLIEAAAGRSYYDLLEDRILGPQRLDQVVPARDSALQGIATGYSGGSSVIRDDGRMKFDPRAEWTGGGLVTNPTMLVQFFGALAEGRIVTPESLQMMLEGGWTDPEASGPRYGLGLFIDEGGGSISHGGLWSGYRSHVTHDLATGITVAVQTNRDGRLDLESLALRIAAEASRP